jgi:threonyl-tRNA synthetase
MLRVRAFTQDDAHIFCTLDQIESEVANILELADKIYSKFGFSKIVYALSTVPEKFSGTKEMSQMAEDALHKALKARGIEYKIQEGEGAFYAPKIEIKIEDTMGREWQCGTVQLDFNLPINFELEYIQSDQSKAKPVVIHRAIYGSIERFLGILLEHYKGHFPFWLAPIQIRILKITDAQQNYASTILQALKDANLRVELDHSGDQISAQIRRAQMDKIPWMVVVGKKEEEQNTITLRYVNGQQESGISVEELIVKAKKSLF